jgi:hypothetical protein
MKLWMPRKKVKRYTSLNGKPIAHDPRRSGGFASWLHGVCSCCGEGPTGCNCTGDVPGPCCPFCDDGILPQSYLLEFEGLQECGCFNNREWKIITPDFRVCAFGGTNPNRVEPPLTPTCDCGWANDLNTDTTGLVDLLLYDDEECETLSGTTNYTISAGVSICDGYLTVTATPAGDGEFAMFFAKIPINSDECYFESIELENELTEADCHTEPIPSLVGCAPDNMTTDCFTVISPIAWDGKVTITPCCTGV